MATVIPTTNDRSQEFRVDLESVIYTLKIMYNSRANWWAMNISSEDGTPILDGVVLSQAVNFLEPYGLGIGGMTLWDTDVDNPNSITPEDLGDRLVLIHFSQAEVDSGTVS